MKKLLCCTLLVCLLCAMTVSALAAEWPTFHFNLNCTDTDITIDKNCKSPRTGTGNWRVKVNTAQPGTPQGRGIYFNCYRTANEVRFGNGIWVSDKQAHNGTWSRTPVADKAYSPAARADNQLTDYSVKLTGYFDAQQLATTP